MNPAVKTSRRLQSRTLGQGFVPLVRSVETFEEMRDPVMFTIHAMISIRARYHSAGRDGLEIGQMVLGRASLAAEMRLTEGQIRAALGRLQSAGQIAMKATSRGTVVSLLKTSVFDCGAGDNDQPNAAFAPGQLPAARRIRARPATTNEEGKEKENTTVAQASPARARDELFAALCQAEGSNPDQLTKSAARSVAVALAEIRRAMPSVTPEDIKARAAEYHRKMPGGTRITAHALAKHWPKLGGEPVAPIGATTAPDGPACWREILEELRPGNAVSPDPGRSWSSLPDSVKAEVLEKTAVERRASS